MARKIASIFKFIAILGLILAIPVAMTVSKISNNPMRIVKNILYLFAVAAVLACIYFLYCVFRHFTKKTNIIDDVHDAVRTKLDAVASIILVIAGTIALLFCNASAIGIHSLPLENNGTLYYYVETSSELYPAKILKENDKDYYLIEIYKKGKSFPVEGYLKIDEPEILLDKYGNMNSYTLKNIYADPKLIGIDNTGGNVLTYLFLIMVIGSDVIFVGYAVCSIIKYGVEAR